MSNQLVQRHIVGPARAPEEAQADRIADRVAQGEAPSAPMKLSGQTGWSPFRNRGRRLDHSVRGRFAPHFAGLAEVRIHDDAESARLAAGLGARAFTAGGEIGFAPGEYAPDSRAGARLLAHELAHLGQGGDMIRRQPVDEAAAEEEEEAAGLVAPPRPASLLSLDYSGPEVCGGRPCFSDEMMAEMMEREDEQLRFDAAVASLPPSIGEIGPYQVSVGPVSDLAQTPAAGVAATAQLPRAAPPTNVMVQGGREADAKLLGGRMAAQTGLPVVSLGKGALVGAQEVSLVAHGNVDLVKVGKALLTPAELADRLVAAGWRGRIVRLVTCHGGLDTGGPVYAQTLADELATRGVESAVIGARGKATVQQGVGLPQVRASNLVRGLLDRGKGWFYAVPEVPLGNAPDPDTALPRWHPSTWRGAGLGVGKMGAMMVLSYIHNRAMAERVREQVEESGFAGFNQGDWLDRLGDLIHDPLGDAARSISICDRFDMTRWRISMSLKAAKQPVGKKWEVSWTTSGDPDPLGNRGYRTFTGVYRKMPDGYWLTVGCNDCEGKDFPPDLNVILDPLVSDDEVYRHLDVPRDCSFSQLA